MTLFVSTWRQGVFHSMDGGTAWALYDQGLTIDVQADTARFYTPQFRTLQISRTFSQDGTLYLGGFAGLFRSTDRGQNWSKLWTLSVNRIEGFAVSPTYAENGMLLTTTYDRGAYVSEDGGKTWENRSEGLGQPRLEGAAFSPNYAQDGLLFTNTNRHLYQSSNKGRTWESRPLRGRDWVSMIVTVQKKLYNRGLYPNWIPIFESYNWPVFPRRIVISPDFKSDGTIYVSSLTQHIFRSVDRGQKWSSVWRGEDDELRGYVDLAISPQFASDNTLYAGNSVSGIVYKSTDRGTTWRAVYRPDRSVFRERLYLAISPAYQEDQTVFAGTRDGLMKTTTGGEHWEPVSHALIRPEDTILTLAISPDYQNDKTLLVSVKGKGLFKYLEDRSELISISSHLIKDNYGLRFIAFSPHFTSDRTLFGAAIDEVFQSTDGGDTWRLLVDLSDRDEPQ